MVPSLRISSMMTSDTMGTLRSARTRRPPSYEYLSRAVPMRRLWLCGLNEARHRPDGLAWRQEVIVDQHAVTGVPGTQGTPSRTSPPLVCAGAELYQDGVGLDTGLCLFGRRPAAVPSRRRSPIAGMCPRPTAVSTRVRQRRARTAARTRPGLRIRVASTWVVMTLSICGYLARGLAFLTDSGFQLFPILSASLHPDPAATCPSKHRSWIGHGGSADCRGVDA